MVKYTDDNKPYQDGCKGNDYVQQCPAISYLRVLQNNPENNMILSPPCDTCWRLNDFKALAGGVISQITFLQ
ncbi:MAG: hypothetical protein WCJ58_05800 [bacterium]